MRTGRRYQVEWTETAVGDLDEILDYIASDDLPAAETIWGELRGRAESLTTFPLRGRVVPELQGQGVSLYRELVHNPWRILYRVSEYKVYVVTVCDSRRNLEDLLLDRFLRAKP